MNGQTAYKAPRVFATPCKKRTEKEWLEEKGAPDKKEAARWKQTMEIN